MYIQASSHVFQIQLSAWDGAMGPQRVGKDRTLPSETHLRQPAQPLITRSIPNKSYKSPRRQVTLFWKSSVRACGLALYSTSGGSILGTAWLVGTKPAQFPFCLLLCQKTGVQQIPD